MNSIQAPEIRDASNLSSPGNTDVLLRRAEIAEGRLEILRRQRLILRERTETLLKERDEARRLAAEMSKQASAANNAATLRTRIEALLARQDILRKKLAATQKALASSREQKTAVQAKHSTMRHEIRDLRTLRSVVLKSLDIPLPTSGDSQSLRKAVASSLKQQASAANNAATLRTRNEALLARQDILRNKLAATQKALASSREQKTAVQAKHSTMRHEIRDLRTLRSVVLKSLDIPLPASGDSQSLRKAVALSLKQQASEGILAHELACGADFDTAAIATVRRMLNDSNHVLARSLSQALVEHSGTENVGHAGVALVAMHQKLYDLAHYHLNLVPSDFRFRHAPKEWMSLQFARDADAAVQLVHQHEGSLADHHDLVFIAASYAYREHRRDLAQEILALLHRLSDGAPKLTPRNQEDYEWLLSWEKESQEREIGQVGDSNAINIGVLDYKQPDFLRQSSNLGDWIQTIGSLGHLLKHRGTRFTGDGQLLKAADYLGERLRPDMGTDNSIDRTVNLVRVNRDASGYDPVPENTWLVTFGWYMHSTFGGAYAFPFHRNINPIFISFHVQNRNMLTPAAVEYLKTHGPIGCRDWTTTYILLSLGIDAFFSGCLTTTVDAFFPQPGSVTAGNAEKIAVVDTPVPSDLAGGQIVERITQASHDICRSSFDTNIRSAVELLESYRGFGRIVTSRLHCYLPATAIGCDVEFVPRRLSDVRFDGLLGMKPGNAPLRSIQDGLRAKLDQVYGDILQGKSTEEVYAQWRKMTKPEVELAKNKLAAPYQALTPTFDEEAVCAEVVARSVVMNERVTRNKKDVVNVALASDQNLQSEVPVVIESILSNTSRAVHFWFLTRGYSDADLMSLAATFPSATFTFLPCDAIDYGPVLGMLKHITVSTMDRLLLPLLLRDVDRVIYHDIDAVTLADIGKLYDTDLMGKPLAARSARASWAESGFGNIYRAANRLDHQLAFEMRRRMHQTVEYDFLAFNAGIMLLDLRRMRADGFCREYIPFAEQFGMNDQEILNCYVGTDRLQLDPSWNAVLQQEVVSNPNIIHWAGPAKPWKPEYVVHQDVWDHYVQQVNAHYVDPSEAEAAMNSSRESIDS